MSHSYDWGEFYRAMARAILPYRDKRAELFLMIKKAAAATPLMHYLHFEHAEFWNARNDQIDPFTVMGIFNRAATPEHRTMLAKELAGLFGVKIEPPAGFHGIAYLDPRNSIFGGNEEMWNLYGPAVAGKRDSGFQDAFSAAIGVKGNALGILSIGLFWMNPENYMPLDSISVPYIQEKYGLEPLADKCSGSKYAAFLNSLDAKLERDLLRYPKLAYAAWSAKNGGEE